MKTFLAPLDYCYFRRNVCAHQILWTFPEALDPARLDLALRELVATEEIFGATLGREGARLYLSPRELVPDLEIVESMPDLAGPTPMEARSDLAPALELRAEAPLIKLRLYRGENRSALALSLAQLLGDARSAELFMRALAARYRGEKTPFGFAHDRRRLMPGERRKPRSLSPERLTKDSGFVLGKVPTPTAFTWENLHFSGQRLEALRREAGGGRLSSVEVVAAYLFQKYQNDFPFIHGQKMLRVSVEHRRISHKDAPYFFGNAVKDAVLTFTAEDLPAPLLSEVARAVHEKIRDLNIDDLRRQMAALEDLRFQDGVEIFSNLTAPGLSVEDFTEQSWGALRFGEAPAERVAYLYLKEGHARVHREADGSLSVLYKRPQNFKA